MQEFLKEIAKNGKIIAKKSLGQNFIVNTQVIQKIIETCEISANKTVVEIGCGLGSLTFPILEKTQNFIGIEKDTQMIEILESNFPEANFLCQDALQVNWNEIECDVIVSNLPYNIGTKILLEIAINSPAKSFIVMLQKDVISKIFSKPQTNNVHQLGVFFQSFCNLELVCIAPCSAFSPVPNVVSQVIKITPKQHNINLSDFWNFLHTASQHKRKTLRNIFPNIKNYGEKRLDELSIAEILQAFKDVKGQI